MDSCKICSNNFQCSPDTLVLCDHKGGMVHTGCCVGKCSQDHKPCVHSVSRYAKITK